MNQFDPMPKHTFQKYLYDNDLEDALGDGLYNGITSHAWKSVCPDQEDTLFDFCPTEESWEKYKEIIAPILKMREQLRAVEENVAKELAVAIQTDSQWHTACRKRREKRLMRRSRKR